MDNYGGLTRVNLRVWIIVLITAIELTCINISD